MSVSEIRKAVQALGAMITEPPRLLVISGGEPTIERAKLEAAIVAARECGLSPRLNTNGYYVDASLAQFLATHQVLTQVSVDGADAATHALLRGNVDSFSHALSAVEQLVEHGGRVRISFTVHSRNVNQIPQMLGLAQRLGAEQLVTSGLVGIGNALRHNIRPVEFATEFSMLYAAIRDSTMYQSIHAPVFWQRQ
jgi:MoaA/NifB/PqqE/SkfB family radical SAM enzyme